MIGHRVAFSFIYTQLWSFLRVIYVQLWRISSFLHLDYLSECILYKFEDCLFHFLFVSRVYNPVHDRWNKHNHPSLLHAATFPISIGTVACSEFPGIKPLSLKFYIALSTRSAILVISSKVFGLLFRTSILISRFYPCINLSIFSSSRISERARVIFHSSDR